jgi:predicted enzyme related to lactoylglutathione lyase
MDARKKLALLEAGSRAEDVAEAKAKRDQAPAFIEEGNAELDVPDLDRGVVFYVQAFGLGVTRRLGSEVVELAGWPVRVYLLQKPSGSIGAQDAQRHYDRHWTPVHFDVVVLDIEPAAARAVAAVARAETEIRVETWGRIAGLADPFGHGFCVIEFVGRGYDEIAASDAQT